MLVLCYSFCMQAIMKKVQIIDTNMQNFEGLVTVEPSPHLWSMHTKPLQADRIEGDEWLLYLRLAVYMAALAHSHGSTDMSPSRLNYAINVAYTVLLV